MNDAMLWNQLVSQELQRVGGVAAGQLVGVAVAAGKRRGLTRAGEMGVRSGAAALDIQCSLRSASFACGPL
jgi:hypothetical protein